METTTTHYKFFTRSVDRDDGAAKSESEISFEKGEKALSEAKAILAILRGLHG